MTHNSGVRAAFTTLGCKVNQYETQRILETFEEAGFAVVPFDAAADVYVINTCSVTSIAESKSRYAVRRARRAQPDAVVVVTGCATQMALNREEHIPDADVMVPNPDKLETLTATLRARPDGPCVRAPICVPSPSSGQGPGRPAAPGRRSKSRTGAPFSAATARSPTPARGWSRDPRRTSSTKPNDSSPWATGRSS